MALGAIKALQGGVSLDGGLLAVSVQSLVGVVDVIVSALELAVILDEVGQGLVGVAADAGGAIDGDET